MATDKTELMTALEFDGKTGQSTVRELTSDEIAEHDIMRADATAQQVEADAKAAARDSALAKLSALGLTPEEIASL